MSDFLILNQVQRFMDWSSRKVQIHFASHREVLFHESEIWWANLGENVGSETNGKNFRFEKPVIILKKYSHNLLFTIPCTSRLKEGSWFFAFRIEGRPRRALIAQGRSISSKRLIRRMCRLEEKIFIDIQNAFLRLIKTDPSA